MKIKYKINEFILEKSLEKLGFTFKRFYMGENYPGGKWFAKELPVQILLTKDRKIFCERDRIKSLQSIDLIKSEQDLITYLKKWGL